MRWDIPLISDFFPSEKKQAAIYFNGRLLGEGRDMLKSPCGIAGEFGEASWQRPFANRQKVGAS